MAPEWYTKIFDEVSGPFDANELKAMASSGRLLPDSLVRRGASSDWKLAEGIKGLTFEATSIASPLPPIKPPKPTSKRTESASKVADRWGFLATANWLVQVIRWSNWIAAFITVVYFLSTASDYSDFVFMLILFVPIFLVGVFVVTELEVISLRFMHEVIVRLDQLIEQSNR